MAAGCEPARAGAILIRGVRLECASWGPAPDGAPTIVLLHEGLGCVRLWGDFPSRLAAATGLGVFAYSRAGYGDSDPIVLPRPLSYMHDEARDVLPHVLDDIGFRRGLLAGHSDGASIAAIYAGSHADHRVSGLVLMAPHFLVEDVSIRSIAAAREAFETGDLRRRLAKYHGANVDCAFKGWNGAWLDPGFRAWDIRAELGYIRVPVLIVQGEADRYGTLAQIEAARSEIYSPVDVVLLPATGHAPHIECPDDTLRSIAEFTRGLLEIDLAASPFVTMPAGRY